MLNQVRKHFDAGSILVIAITFVLFAIALFTTGFTHDLLLETGVFLISVKIIQLAYSNSVNNYKIREELEEIKALIKAQNKHSD